jgi:hypothetical protein
MILIIRKIFGLFFLRKDDALVFLKALALSKNLVLLNIVGKKFALTGLKGMSIFSWNKPINSRIKASNFLFLMLLTLVGSCSKSTGRWNLTVMNNRLVGECTWSDFGDEDANLNTLYANEFAENSCSVKSGVGAAAKDWGIYTNRFFGFMANLAIGSQVHIDCIIKDKRKVIVITSDLPKCKNAQKAWETAIFRKWDL